MAAGRARKRGKVRRLNIRATEHQEELIRTGAERAGISVTDFILESACMQAEQALADRKEFVIPPAKWQQFLERLDRPARVKPELVRLFSGASPLKSRSPK
jgi:uncharacterized protein (DUF1778 family)